MTKDAATPHKNATTKVERAHLVKLLGWRRWRRRHIEQERLRVRFAYRLRRAKLVAAGLRTDSKVRVHPERVPDSMAARDAKVLTSKALGNAFLGRARESVLTFDTESVYSPALLAKYSSEVRKGGRPRLVTPAAVAELLRLKAEGATWGSIGARLGLSSETVRKAARKSRPVVYPAFIPPVEEP